VPAPLGSAGRDRGRCGPRTAALDEDPIEVLLEEAPRALNRLEAL